MKPGQRYLRSSEKKLKLRGKSRRERKEVMQIMLMVRGLATVMTQEGQAEELS